MTAAPDLFVTGAARTGTSLLARLLSAHPGIDILSQPLPRLYPDIKRLFLETRQGDDPPSDLARAFPLGDQFDANHADPARFTAYLQTLRLDRAWLIASLRGMAGFSGQGVRPDAPVKTLVPEVPLGLAAFTAGYFARVSRHPEAEFRGSKEIVAEEFVAYLLQSGTRVIHVVRDPRDVVASVFGPGGADYAGGGLPLLFVLRQWRKSVAFALHHDGDPRFRLQRYEDLVTWPDAQLAGIAGWLGCAGFPGDIARRPLVDDRGRPWPSNSSYQPRHRISRAGVGRGRSDLAPALVRAIETLCGPELRALGYDPGSPAVPAERPATLEAAADPCRDPRPVLADYGWSRAALAPELRRLTALEAGDFEPRLHLFPAAFRRLRGPAAAPDRPQFAFLICSERSGSNLLTSLLNGHPDISAPPPSHLFRLFAGNAVNYGDLTQDSNWRTLLQDVADAFAAQLGSWNTVLGAGDLAARALKRQTLAPVAELYLNEAAHDDARLVFVKENHTARFAPALREALPGCRFVFMVRDPRDVAASYLTTDGIAGGAERAVDVWCGDQAETRDLLRQTAWQEAVHCLRYEDLLADPLGEVARLTGFLGLEHDPAVMAFYRDPRTRRNAGRIDAWKNLARPVQSGNAGKYRKVLTRAEIEYVELCCRELMQSFGYDCDIVTEPPGTAILSRRIAALRPRLRPGSYRLGTDAEIETRRRRLAIIERVRARRLP